MKTQLSFITESQESDAESYISFLKYCNRLIEIEHLLSINFGDKVVEKFQNAGRDVFGFFEKLSYIKNSMRKMPFISATEDGSEIVLEWQSDKAKLYMSFYGDEKYSYYAKILDDNGAIKKEHFVNDYSFIGVDDNKNECEIDSLFLVLNEYFFQKEVGAEAVPAHIDFGIQSDFKIIEESIDENIDTNTKYV